MNCNINSSGLYNVDSYNLTTTNATVLSTLNVAGNIIGSGTALSNLNYGSITNPPDLTVYDTWTKVTGTTNIYNTALTTGNVGIGTNEPLSLLHLNTTTYSKPLLILNAGIPYAGTARGIGQVLLGVGGKGFTAPLGDYYGIGFGYLNQPSNNY